MGRRIHLTPREREIVAAVVEGCSNQVIAAQLGIRVQSVKNQMTLIFNKVGVSSRLELALYVVAHRHLLD